MRDLYSDLDSLNREYNQVFNSELEYLPEYGYSSKNEILSLIEQDIKDVESEISNKEYDYTPEELEFEKSQLCMNLGISRYC